MLTLTNRQPSRKAEKAREYRRACALDTGPEADARRKRQRERTRERQKKYRERLRTKRAQSNHLIVLDEDTYDALSPPSLPLLQQQASHFILNRQVAAPSANDAERSTSPSSGAGARDTGRKMDAARQERERETNRERQRRQ